MRPTSRPLEPKSPAARWDGGGWTFTLETICHAAARWPRFADLAGLALAAASRANSQKPIYRCKLSKSTACKPVSTSLSFRNLREASASTLCSSSKTWSKITGRERGGKIEWRGRSGGRRPATLHYRGRELKRENVSNGRAGDARDDFVKYYYTGWQNAVLPATSNVERAPEMAAVTKKYNAWVRRRATRPRTTSS